MPIKDSWRYLGLWLLFATLSASASDLTILAVGAFGQSLAQCSVNSFKLAGRRIGDRLNYKDRFEGLSGRDLPTGNYEVFIHCDNQRLRKEIKLSRDIQLEVVTASDRIVVGDRGEPKLTVKFNLEPQVGQIWWIRLLGLYNDKLYVEPFSATLGVATLIDPEPGSYIATVLSNDGYVCMHEVDFVERTRFWTFNPDGCTFTLDRFAHLVTDQDRRNQKHSQWYQEMRKDGDDFLRRVLEAEPKTR
jgi:hypothetical protein